MHTGLASLRVLAAAPRRIAAASAQVGPLPQHPPREPLLRPAPLPVQISVPRAPAHLCILCLRGQTRELAEHLAQGLPRHPPKGVRLEQRHVAALRGRRRGARSPLPARLPALSLSLAICSRFHPGVCTQRF